MKIIYSLIFLFAFMAQTVSAQTPPDEGTGIGNEPPATQIPEPSTIVLLAAGLLGLGLVRKRRK